MFPGGSGVQSHNHGGHLTGSGEVTRSRGLWSHWCAHHSRSNTSCDCSTWRWETLGNGAKVEEESLRTHLPGLLSSPWSLHCSCFLLPTSKWVAFLLSLLSCYLCLPSLKSNGEQASCKWAKACDCKPTNPCFLRHFVTAPRVTSTRQLNYLLYI